MAIDKNRLLNFADSLQAMNAGQSGNTQGQALYMNRIKQRKLDEEKKIKEEEARLKAEKIERDKAAFIAANPEYAQMINMNQLFGITPPAAKQRRIVQQNGIQYYADDQTPVLPNAPAKSETAKQQYDNLAAKIKIEIANNGRNSPNLTKSQLDFYDDYIKTGSINYLNKSISQMMLGNTGGQNNQTKNYTVTNSAYGSMSANQIIDQAMQLNPGATKEGVIKNLLANKIISE